MKINVVVLLLFLAVGLVSLAWAAEEVTGEWEMTMEFGGQESFATLVISQESDGSYSGKWGSNKLSDITIKSNKLSFVQVRTMGDREFTLDYAGILKDGKLEGMLSNERGDYPANGVRPTPKSPALGQWDITFTIGDRKAKARLSVSQKDDGSLNANWKEDMGEHSVTDVTFKDDTLTVDRHIKFQEREFDVTYTGKIDGDTLTGSMEGPRGEIPANGSRFGTEIIGTWSLTSKSEWGERTSLLKVYPDLSGRYESFMGELPVDIKLDGKKISFDMELGFGDRTFNMDFAGTLDGKKLTGEMTNPRGSAQITGKKIEQVSPAVGEWEFTRETGRGTFTSTLKIADAKKGTYAFRDNEVDLDELTVDGNNVAFKVTMKFNEREIPLEFKGKVAGTIIKGQWTSPRRTRDVEGKRVTAVKPPEKKAAVKPPTKKAETNAPVPNAVSTAPAKAEQK